MNDLGDLKEKKCAAHKKGMTAHEFDWKTRMAASTRSKTKDVFDGLIDQALADNSAAKANGDPPLFTQQEVDDKRAENERAHTGFSAALPSHMSQIERLVTTPRFPEGSGKTAFNEVLAKIKEITDGNERTSL